jgi:hypothetical protein
VYSRRLARPGGDGFLGRGNLVCDLGREETRQVLRRLAFGDRAVQQVPCPVDHDRDDRGLNAGRQAGRRNIGVA